MARKAEFSEETVRAAERLVAEADTAREVKAGLSVILSVKLKLSNAQVASMLGVGVATVARLHGEVRTCLGVKTSATRGWGGRRHANLTLAEEKVFLEPWEELAGQGGVLVVPPIRAALEARVGHHVAATTVYRLLARHGWRRVAPDSAHPSRDAEAQEAFKKGASRKVWCKR